MDAAPQHHKRVRHFDEEGHARSLTFSCFQRRPFLSKVRSRGWMIDAMELARRKHGYHVWAYVLMPEHVHLLVWPTADGAKMKDFLNTLKQSVSKKAFNFLRRESPEYLERLGTSFHFWQAGPGYDRNLWNPAYIWETIDYIHANPVRRNLCARPGDWYWSSAAAYLEGGDVPVSIDRGSLPADPRG